MRRLEVVFAPPVVNNRAIEVVLAAAPDWGCSVHEGVLRDSAYSIVRGTGPDEARDVFLQAYADLIRMGWRVIKTTLVNWHRVVGGAGPMADPDMTLSPWLRGVVAMNRQRAEISPGTFRDLGIWAGDGPLPYAASRETWRTAGDAAEQWRITWFVATEALASKRLAPTAASFEATARWVNVRD